MSDVMAILRWIVLYGFALIVLSVMFYASHSYVVSIIVMMVAITIFRALYDTIIPRRSPDIESDIS